MFEKEQYELKGKKFYTNIDLWSSKYHSLMTNVQKGFLMSLIEENKINNVLEIGVFNGVSSLCILKAGLSINSNFNLYSIDISNNKDFIGKAVFDFCSEKELQHYHLNLNTTSSNINKCIDKNIKLDLVFIDGGHAHPEPLFDLLYSIPYMHDNTIIILHDIIDYMRPNVWGPSFIFESWTGDKYRLYDYDNNVFSNMGCIKLHSNKDELYQNILEISKTPFRASPRSMLVYNVYDTSIKKTSNTGLSFSTQEIKELSNYISKNYKNELYREIENILIHNYNTYMDNYLLYMQETRFFNYVFETASNNINRINKLEYNISKLEKENIHLKFIIKKIADTIVWWIPVKKLRDKFRNKLSDQIRSDQIRSDQIRSNIIYNDYIYFYNNSKYKKMQPMLQYKILA